MLSWFKKKTPENAPDNTPQDAPESVVAVAPVDVATDEVDAEEAKDSWLSRLGAGLGKSTTKFTTGLSDLVSKRKLDLATLETLEDLLITSDLGPKLAAAITEEFDKHRFAVDAGEDEIKEFLARAIASRLEKVEGRLQPESAKPFVALMVGVNGAGKTTTLGKLAMQFKTEGQNVMLAAGDTFRAAAVEQLQEWGRRANVPVLAKETGADAAGLAYEAVQDAKAQGADILMIDTAGRLQNRTELMAELQKIIRAIQKADATAPHAVLLVLDATTGQNALSQVETFRQMVNVSGLIVTKLDGTAKGGVVVALADAQNLPIIAVGVGEKIGDLQPFSAAAFARALVGLPASA